MFEEQLNELDASSDDCAVKKSIVSGAVEAVLFGCYPVCAAILVAFSKGGLAQEDSVQEEGEFGTATGVDVEFWFGEGGFEEMGDEPDVPAEESPCEDRVWGGGEVFAGD